MTKNPSQSGELGVQSVELGAEGTELGAAAIKEQLADIRDKVEKQKIPLSKEVEDYTRENLRKVQDKLAAGEPVFPSDMDFIGKVELWLAMPEKSRGKYQGIEEMGRAGLTSGVDISDFIEAEQRDITIKQWFALLHMARLAAGEGKEKDWLDWNFKFPGGKKIETVRWLIFENCPGLRELPDDLTVCDALTLRDCPGLAGLPENLRVSKSLILDRCPGIRELPQSLDIGWSLELIDCAGVEKLPGNLKIDAALKLKNCTGLKELPKNLKIKGFLDLEGCTGIGALPKDLEIDGHLNLAGCTGLKKLPENLGVGDNLILPGCTGLTELPESLNVGKNLYLGKNSNPRVKTDAERLKKEGKIGGEIKYE